MSDFKRHNNRGGRNFQRGRFRQDRRNAGGSSCFKCGQEGHFARNCMTSDRPPGDNINKNGHNTTTIAKRRFQQPFSLEFPDYQGQKLHDLPTEIQEYVAKKVKLEDGKKDSEEENNIPNYGAKKFNSEADVGITAYLNGEVRTAFDCILKHRYSDFNVNEVEHINNCFALMPNVANKVGVVVIS